jgi:hypothetical protein
MRTLLALAAFLPLAAHALTVDEVVAKNLAARGGADKLHAIKSAQWTGKLRLDGGVEADYAVLAARAPGRVRENFTVQGFTDVYAWDGKAGWKIEPGGGRKDPEHLTADDSKSLVEDTDFAGVLVEAKAKGYKVDYLGTEDVDGTGALKLKVTRGNGDFHYVFLDPDHFLEIRTETHRWVRGAEEVTEADFGEYEQVNGTWWPFLLSSGPKGGGKNVALIDKLELDVPADDAQFRFPEAPKKK